MIRALGETRAVVVGQGLGAWIAWTMPTFHPDVTRAVGTLSMPHPRILRHASWFTRAQRRRSRWLLGMQIPFLAERRMARSDRYVERLLRRWASPATDFPTDEDVEFYGEAMRIPFVAHSAAEHYRWLGRSSVRPDGPLFMRRIRHRIPVPVLQIQGADDGCVSRAATAGSGAYVLGAYRYLPLDGAGHFLAEEAPERVNAALLDWLATLD